MDEGKEVCAISFDLRKAFHSVPHRNHIDKLENIGLNQYILRWIVYYLSGRSQYVVCNGGRSSTEVVLSGVPQGSVLGPLLFLIYVNDSTFQPLSISSVINLYADDTLLYRVIKSSHDYVELQCDVNTMALNDTICKYMVISRLKSRALPPHQITLHDQPMERVSNYKYLGVLISDDLSWSPHIDKITSKARRLLGLLYRKFYRWSSPDALLKLYMSLIRPNLVQVWNPHLSKDIKKLESVQKFALKMCLKSWDSSYDDLFDASKLPHLSTRRKCLCLLYFYKAINGLIITPDNLIASRHCNYQLSCYILSTIGSFKYVS